MAELDSSSMFFSVGLLVTDPQFLASHARAVQPEDFPEGPLRALVKLALRHFRKYGTRLTEMGLNAYLEGSDEETVEEMTTAFAYCQKLSEEAEALPLLKEKAEKWLRARWIGRAIDEAGTALKTQDIPTALDALHLAERQVSDPEQREVVLDTALGQVLAKVVTEDYVPTGLDELDRALDGGLRPAEVGLIMAATNVGKSMVAALFAAQAYLSNKRALYYSTELTPDQVLQRVGAAIFKQPIKDLSKNPFFYEQVLEEVRRLAGLDRAEVIVRDGLGSLAALDRELDILEREDRYPDVVIIDTPDDIAPSRQHEKLYAAQGEVHSQLRTHFAQQRHLAIWGTCQTNRDGVDKAKISLRYIADSFVKAQRAHLVLGIAQTEQELQAPFAPRARLIILKDTLHGQKGQQWKYSLKFGRPDTDGYPGFVQESEGF